MTGSAQPPSASSSPRPSLPLLPAPPAVAVRLLQTLLPDSDRWVVLGDLEEQFLDRVEARGVSAARRWYWGQALRFAFALGPRKTLSTLAAMIAPGTLQAAFRSVARSPVSSLLAILILAVGIGAPSTLSSLTATFRAPLPVIRGHEIVEVELKNRASGQRQSVPSDLYLAWREGVDQGSLESTELMMAAYLTDQVGIGSTGGLPERIWGAYATPELFTLLGKNPIEGRVFADGEYGIASTPLGIIREDLWEERFNRDPEAIGKTLRVDGIVYTIVGVMPRDFAFPYRHKIWMTVGDRFKEDIGWRVAGRLAAVSTTQRFEDELLAITLNSPPGTLEPDLVPYIDILSHADAGLGAEGAEIDMIARVSILLLLLAAANVASIMIARGTTRTGETVVRMALGGSRLQIMAHLLAETSILAIAGAAAGLLIAWGGLTGILHTIGSDLPYWVNSSLSPSSFVFAGALAALAVLVAGLIPAIRTSRVDVAHAMKPRSGGDSAGQGRLMKVVVGIEVAVSCAILLVSGVTLRGAVAEASTGADFPTEGVLTARLVLEDFDYPLEADRRVFMDELVERLDADPNILDFALTTALPGRRGDQLGVQVVGLGSGDPSEHSLAEIRYVRAGFFSMFDLFASRGRLIEETDRASSPRVALVNEAFVQDRLSGTQPLGTQIRLEADEPGAPGATIVGVLSDRGTTPDDDGVAQAGVYLSMGQHVPEGVRIMLKSRNGSPPLPALQGVIGTIDPDLPLGDIWTLDEVMRQDHRGPRLVMYIFGSFGIFALLITAVGLHGVTAFDLARRTREIGIRKALGAAEHQVLVGSMIKGLKPVLVGVGVGLLFGSQIVPLFEFDRAIFSSRYAHVCMFSIVPAGLVLLAALSMYAPTRSASNQPPMKVLRDG